MSKELEIIKNRNEKIKINHMIGNRRIANEELKECSIAIENAILEIEKSLTELEELKSNQVKVETIKGYRIDDILAIIQGLKSKEITPEILHSHLKMYKCGYENGIKVANFYIEQAFKNIKKGSDKDE